MVLWNIVKGCLCMIVFVYLIFASAREFESYNSVPESRMIGAVFAIGIVVCGTCHQRSLTGISHSLTHSISRHLAGRTLTDLVV